MHKGKTLVLILSIITIAILLLKYSNPMALTQPYNNYNNDLKHGNWIKYAGTPPHKNCGWLNISVLLIQNNSVTLKLLCGSGEEIIIQVDVTTGEGCDFPYVIPSNLSVGNSIKTSISTLKISGIFVREYAGTSREVVYAFVENTSWNFPTEFYWDRETGIILEVSLYRGRPHTVLKAIETNLWSENLPDVIKNRSIFFIPGIIIAFISIFSYFIYKEETGPSNIFLFRLCNNFYKFLIGIGAVLLVLGILGIAPEKQMLSSISFLLAFPIMSIGLYLKTQPWIGASNLEKLGHLLIMLSIVLLDYAMVAALYSEVIVEVPMEVVVGFMPKSVRTATIFKEVYVYPFASLTTQLISISLPLLFLGVLTKLREI